MQLIKGKGPICQRQKTATPSSVIITRKERLGGDGKTSHRSEDLEQESDLRRDRTCNLLIRSQAPCHWASRPGLLVALVHYKICTPKISESVDEVEMRVFRMLIKTLDQRTR